MTMPRIEEMARPRGRPARAAGSVMPTSASARFLPFSAATALLGIKSATDTAATVAVALSRVQDAVLFGGYTVAAFTIATVLLYRRDSN